MRQALVGRRLADAVNKGVVSDSCFDTIPEVQEWAMGKIQYVIEL